MTRTAIGGIAAGAFIVGLLAANLIPAALAATPDDQLMWSHMRAGSMPMMGTSSMPMIHSGSMPMMGTGSMAPYHWMHDASPGPGR